MSAHSISPSLPQFFQMIVVKLVRQRHKAPVEPGIARFVSADQQDRMSPRIECVENTNGLGAALNPKFTHPAMSGTRNVGGIWKRQRRAVFHQQFHYCRQVVLLAFL